MPMGKRRRSTEARKGRRQPVLPPMLSEKVEQDWESFRSAAGDAGVAIPHNEDLIAVLKRVWACSDFVSTSCRRDPVLLADLVDSGDLLADYAPQSYTSRIADALNGVADERALGEALRRIRRREMVRIAWRDLAGWAELDEVLGDLTGLADACVAGALERLHEWQCSDLPGTRARPVPAMVVLGMGKLGAGELNFSSDIDLIFTYPESESVWQRRHTSPDEYYTRLGQSLINTLHPATDLGFVFRVDMRLRPYGNSGPLAVSFDAMAEYYQLQGREWERYAMIKARPVTGDPVDAETLMEMLRPFVYRRYLDFDAFESLRGLKEQITREVERKGLDDNIKLGPGGIREVEFIAQVFQLVRGGRQPALQQRGVVPVLKQLSVLGHLPETVTSQLIEAYRFLRRLENRLQACDDQQVHRLPGEALARERQAYAMGYAHWDALLSDLAAHRQRVEEHFEQVFATPRSKAAAAGRQDGTDMKAVWLDPGGAEERIAALEAAGFDDAGQACNWIRQFRASTVLRFMGVRGRERLDQLMPLIFSAVASATQPYETLKRVGQLLEAIAGRTAYLTLLLEHPDALAQLVKLCAASPWIATELARHPLLLDELLDPRTLYEPLGREGLTQILGLRLSGIGPADLEQQMDSLRHFKQSAVLRVAAADIVGSLPLMRVSDYLTEIAEVILGKVLELVWNDLVRRYGQPRFTVRGRTRDAGFAVLAYGKLGGIELGYGSDLDLVFLHEGTGRSQYTSGPRSVDNSVFFTRLSQRIIHFLNTLTAAGVLYEVDTRLRPSGSSGLLVSSLKAFSDYQRGDAWTWEHQALVRARVVAGCGRIAQQFGGIRAEVLSVPRDPVILRREVREMRQRMRRELGHPGPDRFDLKQDEGGIADIEFMVQYGVLSWARDHPELLTYTDNIRLLERFAAAGLLTPRDAGLLCDAYRDYRARLHRLALQDVPAVVGADEFAGHREAVTRIWHLLMEEA
jgi:glutamate-ammonia-ligase adenylyltransferase